MKPIIFLVLCACAGGGGSPAASSTIAVGGGAASAGTGADSCNVSPVVVFDAATIVCDSGIASGVEVEVYPSGMVVFLDPSGREEVLTGACQVTNNTVP